MSDEKKTDIVPSDVTELEIVDVREGMFGVGGTGDTSGYGGLTRPIVFPGASQKPYGGWFDEVSNQLATVLPDSQAIERVV
ncbi:MAG: NADH-quinone oxidoreductase subunit C, partial [Aeromicrobium sp.]